MVVAALTWLCNLALLAAEKRADVALLTALGMTPSRGAAPLPAARLGVGALGGVLGTALGGVAAEVLDRTHALPLPPRCLHCLVTSRSASPRLGAIVLTVSLVAALLASDCPGARRLEERRTGKGLRYE